MTKKYKLLTLSLSMLLLAGCDGLSSSNNNSKDKKDDKQDTNPVVNHNWATEWSKDATKHWHACTDEDCESISDEDDHDLGDWIYDSYATSSGWSYGGNSSTTQGERHKECSVCGYETNKEKHDVKESDIPHTHTWADTWSSDNNYHWHACTGTVTTSSFGGSQKTQCTETKDKVAHTLVEITSESTTATCLVAGEKVEKCSVCGYVKRTSSSKLDHNWNAGVVTQEATATTAGVKTYTCSSCKTTKTEAIPPIGNPETDRFTITTDLTKTYEIHTSAQKEYLAYSGNYATIDPNKYPDGKSLLSDSLPVEIKWTFNPDSGKTVSKYSIIFGQKVDLSDGYEIVGTTASSIKVVNPFLGNNYFKLVATYSDSTKSESNIKVLKIDETAPRNLAIGGMTNCRDMGGRETSSGAVIKQGLLYRTSGYQYDYSTKITDAGKTEMLKHLGVKTEINVADGTKYNVNLNGTTVYDALMDYGGSARHHFSRNAESVKNVFKILASESNYPVFFHCRIGTDRTGLVANLIDGLLGVDLNMIYQDYLFSNFGNIQEKRYIGSQAGQDNIENYMNEIAAMPGANFQEKTYNMLLSIGVERSTLDAVINILTDGAKPNNNKGQVVAAANNLTLSGTTATRTARSKITDHSEPEYYAKLTSNASASYTFTTSASGTAKIYGYLGHNDYKTDKKISDSVKVEVDGNEITVPSTTFADAGMGNCSNRTNYYSVYLGEKANLAAGSHTVKITGKANDMKLGVVSVFGINGSSSSGNKESGNQQQQEQGGGTTTHTYKDHVWNSGTKVSTAGIDVKKYECTCGAKKIQFASLDGTLASGSSNKDGTPSGFLKLNANGNSISYTFTLPEAINGTLYFDAMMDSYTGNADKTYQSSKPSGKTKNFSLTVNSADIETTNTDTFGTMLGSTADPNRSGYSCQGLCFYGAVSFISGSNTVTFTRNASYNPLIANFVIIY